MGSRFRPRPIPAGPNGIYMDVVHLERPFGDPELNHDLWVTSDEEQLGMELRDRLIQNGYRIALLGGPMPSVLKTLFSEEELGQMNGEHLQIQSGMPTQIQTGGANGRWPKEPNPISEGDDYVNAVGVFRVTPRITSDACIDLAITPEILHGESRRQFVPNATATGPLDWSIQVGRQSRMFEDLNFVLRLRSGQFALLGCFPNNRDSLGARFFARTKDGHTMQHVLLIRAEPSHEAVAIRTRP